MLVFAAWAICCVAAMLARRHLLWAALCIGPLLILSIDWLTRPAHDPFGFHPWGAIALFGGIATVVAVTCVLSIVRALLPADHGPTIE